MSWVVRRLRSLLPARGGEAPAPGSAGGSPPPQETEPPRSRSSSPAFAVWVLRHAAALPAELSMLIWCYGPSEACIAQLFSADPKRGLLLLQCVGEAQCAELMTEHPPEEDPVCVCHLRLPAAPAVPGGAPRSEAEVRAEAVGAALGRMRRRLCTHALSRVVGLDNRIFRYCGDDCGDALQRGFFGQICVRGAPLVATMREALSAVRMPGEAQRIERLVWSLGQTWYDLQQGGGADCPMRRLCPFASGDSVFVFTYAVLLLNADQRSGVERKMTLDQFVSNLRGTNDGGDLPVEFVRNVFRECIEFPLRAPR